ncbi:MAG: hypothetical protein WAN60_13845 [Candidatus Sulfotelmatobacter sp.]
MEMIFCPNCGKLTGYKRALGFGTFFAALLTAGLWLLAIPFYPKRCITCGLGKSDSVPWYKTWRLGVIVLAGVVAAGVATASLLRSANRKPTVHTDSGYALLGLQGGAKDAGVHASAMAFRLKDCEDKGDGFRDCHYVRDQDEKLLLIFWRDELETVEYEFGIGRYDGILKELSEKYGKPRRGDDASDGYWGSYSEKVTLSLIERSDHTGGVASLHFNGGDLDKYMKEVYPTPPRPPEIPPEVLPEVKRAEQRLFGERAAYVESLGVRGGALQGALAVTTHCMAHDCPDHYAVWTVDLSTGQAAGALADPSEIVVYLGDYDSAENLPPALQAEIEQQRSEGLPSPKRVRYVPQAQ